MRKKKSTDLKLNTNKFALSSGITLTILFLIKHLLCWFISFMGWMQNYPLMQGRRYMMGVVAKGKMGLMLGSYPSMILLGILLVFISAYIGGWIFAWLYNKIIE